MAIILTYDELKKYNSEILTESSTIMKGRKYEKKNFSQSSKNVFLSYSSNDAELIPWIVKVLEVHGGTPYVDKGDERLPQPPSVATAEILKDAIKSCKRLIVFVITNTKDSKWIPWELGLGDGAKSNSDIALFPTGDNAYDTDWIEQEYLGLYQRIVWGRIQRHDKAKWIVLDHKNNTATPLSDWLN